MPAMKLTPNAAMRARDVSRPRAEHLEVRRTRDHDLDALGLVDLREVRVDGPDASDGVEETVYYNGYRAGIDLAGPSDDARGDGGNNACFAHHLGLEHMAFHGVPGRAVLVPVPVHTSARGSIDGEVAA